MGGANDDSTYSDNESVSREMSIEDDEEEDKEPTTVFALQNLRVEKPIGKGAFGTIILSTLKKRLHDDDPEVIAVKCISKRRVEKRHLLKQLGLELAVHRALDHENIIRFYGYQQDAKKVYFFLEYAALGDLLKYAQRFNPKEDEVASICYQVGRAIEYVHGLSLVNRDIKLENILMTAERVPKLTDFGYVSSIGEDGYCKDELFCGTTLYMSVETIMEEPCGQPVDVWAFGVVIFDLLVGFTPFQGDNKEDTYRRIRNIAVPWKDRGVARCIRNCEPLLRSIFIMPPTQRPTMTTVLEDDWFYMFSK